MAFLKRAMECALWTAASAWTVLVLAGPLIQKLLDLFWWLRPGN